MQIPIAMISIWTQTVDMFKRGFVKSFFVGFEKNVLSRKELSKIASWEKEQNKFSRVYNTAIILLLEYFKIWMEKYFYF